MKHRILAILLLAACLLTLLPATAMAVPETETRSKGGKLIESVTLFDIYEGAQLTQGYKSMAYKIVFRAPDRTLKDEEVNKAMDKIVRALEEKEIVLRS